MDLVSRSEEYISSQVGKKPEYITVNDFYRRFELKGSFQNLQDRSFDITPDLELYKIYEQFFSKVHDRLDLSEGSQVWSYSLSSYTQKDSDLLEDWEFYTGAETDVRVDVDIGADFSLVNYERIYSAVIDEIQALYNVSVEKRHIPDFRALYSDMKPLRLQTVRGTVYTKHPQLFYESVDSLETFVSTVGDDKSVSGTEYNVDFILDPDDSVSDELRYIFEDELQDVVDNSVSIVGEEYMIEGESICVGESSYQADGDCVFYYIKIPVTDGDLFKVR